MSKELFPVVVETIPPHLRKGSLIHKCEPGYKYERIEWLENKEFSDELKYVGLNIGVQTVTFMDTKGALYHMFLSDFNDLIKSKLLKEDKVKATWEFVKKGYRYGIKLAQKELLQCL